jgi:hypothetical protein
MAKAEVRCNSDQFTYCIEISTGVIQGDTFATYVIVIVLDYVVVILIVLYKIKFSVSLLLIVDLNVLRSKCPEAARLSICYGSSSWCKD